MRCEEQGVNMWIANEECALGRVIVGAVKGVMNMITHTATPTYTAVGVYTS